MYKYLFLLLFLFVGCVSEHGGDKKDVKIGQIWGWSEDGIDNPFKRSMHYYRVLQISNEYILYYERVYNKKGFRYSKTNTSSLRLFLMCNDLLKDI